MENEVRIVKVYSNNKKKARLKRKKNKFQRIWDAEKQTYVKVRKTKYPTKNKFVTIETEETIAHKMTVIERRQKNKKKKSVPVTVIQKPETKQKSHVVHGKNSSPARIEKATTITMYSGKIKLVWDSSTLKYRNAA